jgi:hypothetical protein
VDEQELVRLAVPVEGTRGHRVGRPDDAHHDVVVEEERDPSVIASPWGSTPAASIKRWW